MERRRLLITIFLLAASCASAFARDGSVRAVVDSQGSVVERNDYYTYGKRHTTGRTYADLKNSPLLFSGKEDQGQALDLASGTTTPSDLHILDFGARHYDPIVPRWTTPDPLAEKSITSNMYIYCSGDPINRNDYLGLKDRPYNYRKDKGVYQIPNTSTPFSMIPSLAYNCHSFAWESSMGDPSDERNSLLVENGVTRWDNNPDNNMEGFEQLSPEEANKPGDRLLYYVDSDGNGQYDNGEEIVHSDVVFDVDEDGNTILVISKMGEGGISINHPCATGFYSRGNMGAKTSRAYFRSSTPPEVIETDLVKEYINNELKRY